MILFIMLRLIFILICAIGSIANLPIAIPTSQPSVNPSSQPSSQPSFEPSGQPSEQPTVTPSLQPTLQPSMQPTGYPSHPSSQPTRIPSLQPSRMPSSQPTVQPSQQPTTQPIRKPSRQPTKQPSSQPTKQPSQQPTKQPIKTPSMQPSRNPSRQPSRQPNKYPTTQPSSQPVKYPTMQPSSQPSGQPTTDPSAQPSCSPSTDPSFQPSSRPSRQPSRRPSGQPSEQPTSQPFRRPSSQPSRQPSTQPSKQPLMVPSMQPSKQPTCQPSSQPLSKPSQQPSRQPTKQPSSQPFKAPSSQPTKQPIVQPSRQPTKQPSRTPTMQPSCQPSCDPSFQPTGQPSLQPTSDPSLIPTEQPSGQPSIIPTRQPSSQPSKMPFKRPSSQPSRMPSKQPSRQPTRQPISKPSRHPTCQPIFRPSRQPSSQPSGKPSHLPSMQPTAQPSGQPSLEPSGQPSHIPTIRPSRQPSRLPTMHPSRQPSTMPSSQPSHQPSRQPSKQPSKQPLNQPSCQPTFNPSKQPSSQPTKRPTTQPTKQPTQQPSSQPSLRPSHQPSMQPSRRPSSQPTMTPSRQPSQQPIRVPSSQPSRQPTIQPYSKPTSQPSRQPTTQPSSHPSKQPSSIPTLQPTKAPSIQPSIQPTTQPTSEPTEQPSGQPSRQPSSQPSVVPSLQPSSQPTEQPSSQPTLKPSCQPSAHPSAQPYSWPSMQPSCQPSTQPSYQPTCQPFSYPTVQPSALPTLIPSKQPSSQPSRVPTNQPTDQPSSKPSMQPSQQPSSQPSTQPSQLPSGQPINEPSTQPSQQPFRIPTSQPSCLPSTQPSMQPSRQPFSKPTGQPSFLPSSLPSLQPSINPSRQPSTQPSSKPTYQPYKMPSNQPTMQPIFRPSRQPSCQPSSLPSHQPTSLPSQQPTSQPSSEPSEQPTIKPTTQPSSQPSSKPFIYPTRQPSSKPSKQPFAKPSCQPSRQPSQQPLKAPSRQPSSQPSRIPSSQPTKQPSCQPSAQPTRIPSSQPSCQPTKQPSCQPSKQPYNSPTKQPSRRPSEQPLARPSTQPTRLPSKQPSTQPSCIPSTQPSSIPSSEPSMQPTGNPTCQPSSCPTGRPTYQPSSIPSVRPTFQPTNQPSRRPSIQPSLQPIRKPSSQPTTLPSLQPFKEPSSQPSKVPSRQPSRNPSKQPTTQPTRMPSRQPSFQPRNSPSKQPTFRPSHQPSKQPSSQPSIIPTRQPTTLPSQQPTSLPSFQPSSQPTDQPSDHPTDQPSQHPTVQPSIQPTSQPIVKPSRQPTSQPSRIPSQQPTKQPTRQPTTQPSKQPFLKPSSQPTQQPSSQPSMKPSFQPSSSPTCQPSSSPTMLPSAQPSVSPSIEPSNQPSRAPSLQPTSLPSQQPQLIPTKQPSTQPSRKPSKQPSLQPSKQPSSQPSKRPTSQPSKQPSKQPISSPSKQPSKIPSSQPSKQPLSNPSIQPTNHPSCQPTENPSAEPSSQPSQKPSADPSLQPTDKPSFQPSTCPSSQPSSQPTRHPSNQPSEQPSTQPSTQPSKQPIRKPSCQPTFHPSNQPSQQPSIQPIRKPSKQPLSNPSSQPSFQPVMKPTIQPSNQPTRYPSRQPIMIPTSQPFFHPSCQPTLQPFKTPSIQPSMQPTIHPTTNPSLLPIYHPTVQPSYRPSIIPSFQPSARPTQYPTCQPSKKPTSQPSKQPSCQPTCIPSSPSGQPSIKPSSQPSKIPSIQPTLQPYSQPSTQPSSQPSKQPSKQPSTQPSLQPTKQPSKQPSNQPSTQPSSQPTKQPTSIPSIQPSDQPTIQPSIQPSSHPSIQPTAQPTSIPSFQPTSQPSWQPSSQPSSQPSTQPSIQPTTQPSVQPSTQPSRQPSRQPSGQPTVRPTSSKPTSKPSSAPSKYPSTSHPTLPGETLHPSKYPTSRPSYDMGDYNRSNQYEYFLTNKTYFASLPNTLNFASFFQKGKTIVGKCNDWKIFSQSSLSNPSDGIEFQSLTGVYSIYDYTAKTYLSNLAYCPLAGTVKTLISNLNSGNEYVTSCNGNTWRVFSCNNERILCVNCKKICVKSASCPGTTFTTNPCSTSCNIHASAYSIVSFRYSYVPSFPQYIVNPNIISVIGSNSDISFSIGSPGIVRCASFLSNYFLQSVTDILSSKYSVSVILPMGGIGTLSVPTLGLISKYNIYCYTEDFNGNMMTIDEVRKSATSFSVNCCKAISFSATHPYITSVSNRITNMDAQIFKIALNAPLTSNYIVNILITSNQCSQMNIISALNASATKVLPSSLTFSESNIENSFIIIGYQGCYQITATGMNGEFLSASTSVIILDPLLTPLPAPTPLIAEIAKDGATFHINFDSDTNVPFGMSSFNCNNLLSFSGSASAQCFWGVLNTLSVILGSSATVVPNSQIKVLGGRIKAACISSNCTFYPYLSDKILNLQPPANPIMPQVSLSAPGTIQACDDIILDASASSGSSGRLWKKIKWSVSGDTLNSTINSIQSYLDQYSSSDISKKIVIPNSLLQPTDANFVYNGNSYKFTLRLTNYLMQSSTQQINVFRDSQKSAIPRISIYGGKNLNYFRWQPINLFADAQFPNCAYNVSNAQLFYTWVVYSGVNVVDIKSSSKDQRFFFIDPFTLQSASTYVVKAYVSLRPFSQVNSILYSAKTTIVISSSDIVAFIAGGTSQYSTILDTVKYLDASSSHYLDDSKNNLNFNWSCIITSPSYGKSCNQFILSNSAILSVPVSFMIAGYDYLFSVIVSDKYGKSASTSVQLTVIDGYIPEISISPAHGKYKYNEDDKIIFSGNIIAKNTVSASWSLLNDKNLSFALTSLTGSFYSGTSTFQLAIKPYSLSQGHIYSFQLSSYYFIHADSIAFATIDVSINRPPFGGILNIDPSSGVAITNIFTLVTNFWTDDTSDYPLNYVFNYFLVDPAIDLTVIKSLSPIPYSKSYLSQGLKYSNYQVYCMVIVSDTYDGKSNVTSTVNVYPIQSTFTMTGTTIAIQSTNLAITQGFLNRDSFAVTQAINAAINTINTVDCNMPSLSYCSNLNRQVCKSTARTCGTCLPGFVGKDGNSNLPCNTSTSLKDINMDCQSNSTCSSGFCKNYACVDVPKECPNKCTGLSNGVCQYFDINNVQIPFCSYRNPYCFARCQCNTALYGRDCSLTSTQFNQLSSFRESLCVNLMKTLSIEDPTSDVITSRAVTLSGILEDSTQLTQSAVVTCSNALIQTVDQNPSTSCAKLSPQLIISAFSKVLEIGCSLPSNLVSNITMSIYNLMAACQNLSANGEVPIQANGANIRVVTSRFYLSEVANLSFSTSLTDFEILSGVSRSEISFNPSMSSLNLNSTIGFSLLQYNNNPKCIVTNSTSTQIKITTKDTPTSNNSYSQRSLPNGIDSYTIVLQNRFPMNYYALNSATVRINCSVISFYDYTKNVSCPTGNFNITCKAGYKGIMTFTCPGKIEKPICTFYNGYSYAENTNCKVITYTPYNTTCLCKSNSGNNRRLTSSFGSTNLDVATSSRLYNTLSSNSFFAFPSLLIVEHNSVIVTALSVIIGLLIIGLIGFSIWDASDISMSKIKKSNAESIRTIQQFFNLIMPEELKPAHWQKLLYDRILLEHTWISIFTIADKRKDLRTVKFTVAMSKLIGFILINTIVAIIFYADDGYCHQFQVASVCSSQMSYGNLFQSCEWRTDNDSCIFKAPLTSFVNLIVFSIIVTVLCVPLNILIEICVKLLQISVVQNTQLEKNPVISKITPIMMDISTNKSILDSPSSIERGKQPMFELWKLQDELLDVQTQVSKYFMAARLRKIQKQIDFVLPSVEVEKMLIHAKDDVKYYGRSELAVETNMWSAFDASETVKHSRYSLRLRSKVSLLNAIISARDKSESIKRITENLLGDSNEKELSLMRQFLLWNFSGVKRNIIKRYLYKSYNTNWKILILRVKQSLAVIIVPLIFVAMSYYVYRYNNTIGSKATNLWIAVLILSLLEDLCLTQPSKIWLIWVVMTSFVNEEFFKLGLTLKIRYKSILNRKAGVMRDSNALIQHLNPVCRAARLFPDLPICRFLLSLNDYDVPIFKVKDSYNNKVINVIERGKDPFQLMRLYRLLKRVFNSLFDFGMYMFTLLPYFVQDGFLDIVGILFINLLPLSLYFLGTVSVAGAILVALFILIAFMIRVTEVYKNEKVMDMIKVSVPIAPSSLYKASHNFEEMNNDFDARVLFKSQFSVLDSEITKVVSNYEKKKNKYAKTRQIVAGPSIYEEKEENKSIASKKSVDNLDNQLSISSVDKRIPKNNVKPIVPMLDSLNAISNETFSIAIDKIPADFLPTAEINNLTITDKRNKSKKMKLEPMSPLYNTLKVESFADSEQSGIDSESARRRSISKKNKKRINKLAAEISALKLEVDSELQSENGTARSKASDVSEVIIKKRYKKRQEKNSNKHSELDGPGQSNKDLKVETLSEVVQNTSSNGPGSINDNSHHRFQFNYGQSLQSMNTTLPPMAANKVHNTESQFPTWH